MQFNIKLIFGLLLITTLTFTSKLFAQTNTDTWFVPTAAKHKLNPLKANEASIASGKILYNQQCGFCHGAQGKGDGPFALQQALNISDFSTIQFNLQTDGELYYKISEGRKSMPAFKTKIANKDEIWAIINYIRSLCNH